MTHLKQIVMWIVFLTTVNLCVGATTLKHYYAHDAVEDEHGVIAPWYTGLNGQCDARVRVAAETLKRYPWADSRKAPRPLPEYIYSGHWGIGENGKITAGMIEDWTNGDYGQRAAYTLGALIEYYRYTGDAAALAHVALYVDALLDFSLTPEDHPWPRFPVSVPVRGKPYGQADPRGFIQLDIVGEMGVWVVRAARIMGNERWLAAASHWGDLLAENRLHAPGLSPWPRYANPADALWEDRATGGVVYILEFLDELIRAGYTGKDNALIKAREAGVAYLRDVLLPDWTGHDIWGRNYWDWSCGVQILNVTTFAARYLMNHPDEFPNWPHDVRNILGLFLNRTSVSPLSNADVFSGAWAYPESLGCCDRSLIYSPQEVATAYAQYGVLADSEWGREMARRQIILATYDFHETGVVEDLIDGGAYVDKTWFKIAHPWVLKNILHAMSWMPEYFGAARENHIMHGTAVITNAVYDDGLIRFDTHDAPAGTATVLRLAFCPTKVMAGDKSLERNATEGNGYQVKELKNGDTLVTIRHDGLTSITIQGDDPQEQISEQTVQFSDGWKPETVKEISCWVSSEKGSSLTVSFTGNQVRLIGGFAPDGGLGEIYLDGEKQLVGIDCWNPSPRFDQLLYYRNGLKDGPHELRIMLKGEGNPHSTGAKLYVQKVLYSAATGIQDFGSGGGPTDAQRMIFGYTGRVDYVDSQGHTWRPGTEFIIRAQGTDTVASAWYTQPRQMVIAGTDDPELYRYGVHGKDFWVDFTVGPGNYHARLKFMESRYIDPKLRCVSVSVNGREMIANMDIAATAAQGLDTARLSEPATWKRPVFYGMFHAVDVVLNDLKPVNGVISIRFRNDLGGEAMIQAIEIGPGDAGQGAAPIRVKVENQPAASK